MTNVTYENIPVCSQLYDVPYFFPRSPESGLVFYSSLLAFTLFVLCYMLYKIRHQRQLLQKGEIRTMKDYLLPIYSIFLYFCVAVYGVKAIDIAIAYIVYVEQFQQGMPTTFAIFHAASFWTSEFWLFDLLIFFLTSNSHGTLTIRRAFWVSTLIWIANATTITFVRHILYSSFYYLDLPSFSFCLFDKKKAIKDPYLHAFLNFVAVYAVQCLIGLFALVFMCAQRYPHHTIELWSFILLKDEMREKGRERDDNNKQQQQKKKVCRILFYGFGGYCLEYDSTMACHIRFEKRFKALEVGQPHDTHITYMYMFKKKEFSLPLCNILNFLIVMGHERPSMTVWTELLSQHTKILKSAKLVPIEDKRRMMGGSGQVTQAMYKNEKVAVKQWRFENFTKNVVALWCKEALISSNFQHPNIVKLIGICIEPPSIKIVMEWCKHGSLRHVLTSSRPLPWKQRFHFLLGFDFCVTLEKKDIANGMRHLHRNGLVHRDLKTLNLLVDEDPYNERFVVKICDFGSSRAVNLQQYKKKTSQGLLGMSPQDNNGDADEEEVEEEDIDIVVEQHPLPIGGRPPLASIPDDSEVSDYKEIDSKSAIANTDEAASKFRDSRLITSPASSKSQSFGLAAKKKSTIGTESWQGSIDGMGCPDEFEQIRDELVLESGQSSKNLIPSKVDYIDKDVSLTSALLHEVTASMSTIVGSVQFLPPEILKNIEFKQGSRQAHSVRKSVYGFSVDVYSFALRLSLFFLPVIPFFKHALIQKKITAV
ncbi:tyrosine-protein kinase [Reticulomyxa filosa]|uniref:Tyrosine-protein kinase n=1 Tax=Reticulomyxa filosa TaxID=46433 RepID=X6NX83_RETFI|nr:tyrosine-protein kinase [Reticulomyxa filosa]|eukprot:ETO30498.1 tyrosine-protein kinase [Reticulomyxa filosa]